jgi:SP family xylose:H+ symportor-like MFS transporter
MVAMFGLGLSLAMQNYGFPYFVYGVMAVLAALFTWKFIPETKGRTLEELEELWTKKD